MRRARRKIRNVCGAAAYILLAILCLFGAYGVAITDVLSLGRQIFMILAFAVGAFFLVCSAIGVMRRKEN